jgi:hypothetical protein
VIGPAEKGYAELKVDTGRFTAIYNGGSLYGGLSIWDGCVSQLNFAAEVDLSVNM